MKQGAARRWVAAVAVAQIAAGAALGLLSAPFAIFFGSLVDVTSAGLGAVTGAVVMGGGLVALAVLSATSTREPAGIRQCVLRHRHGGAA